MDQTGRRFYSLWQADTGNLTTIYPFERRYWNWIFLAPLSTLSQWNDHISPLTHCSCFTYPNHPQIFQPSIHPINFHLSTPNCEYKASLIDCNVELSSRSSTAALIPLWPLLSLYYQGYHWLLFFPRNDQDFFTWLSRLSFWLVLPFPPSLSPMQLPRLTTWPSIPFHTDPWTPHLTPLSSN